MKKNETLTKLGVLERLFLLRDNFKDDAEGILKMYLDAIDEFEDADVHAGYFRLVRGLVSTYQGAYCPGPAQLATACRDARGVRLSHETIMRAPNHSAYHEIEKTAESKARVNKYLATHDRSALAS